MISLFCPSPPSVRSGSALFFDTDSPILAIGAVAERSRLGPLLAFVFIWSTIVYNPIACWTWNPKGWVYIRGGLDFAGGTPVHIASGTAGLAISLYLGKRKGWGTERLAYKPHNTTYVVLGTVFLWFGWFGFNGGSALAATMRAAMACTVTNVSIRKSWEATTPCVHSSDVLPYSSWQLRLAALPG